MLTRELWSKRYVQDILEKSNLNRFKITANQNVINIKKLLKLN